MTTTYKRRHDTPCSKMDGGRPSDQGVQAH